MRLLPLAAALALSACATTQVQTAQAQIARYYADYTAIKAAVELSIVTVHGMAARADQIHAWEARLDAAFAIAKASGDTAAAYAALRDARIQSGSLGQ